MKLKDFIDFDFISEKSKGLWANIHAKRKRGEKPAKKGSKAYKKAKAAGKKINEGDEDNNPTNKQMDAKLKKKAEEAVGKIANQCQRCGETLNMCACPEDDWASTRNAHLIKPGKTESRTAKNN